jgi:hypothetical protein
MKLSSSDGGGEVAFFKLIPCRAMGDLKRHGWNLQPIDALVGRSRPVSNF